MLPLVYDAIALLGVVSTIALYRWGVAERARIRAEIACCEAGVSGYRAPGANRVYYRVYVRKANELSLNQ